jgi:O-antigen/teichoic acid export membrane protein
MNTPEEQAGAQLPLESGAEAISTLLRNSTSYLMADAVIKLLSFLFTIYVVRRLGDESFGLYSTALAYTNIFSIIADMGLTQLAVRDIARGRRNPDTLLWDLIVIRLGLSTVALVVITGSAYFIAGYPPEMVAGIFLVTIGFYFHAFLGPVRIIFSGKERVDIAAMLNMLIQLFFVSVGTFVLLQGFSFYGLIIAGYIGVPVAAIVGAVLLRRVGLATLRFRLQPSTWLPLLRLSLPFAVITFTLVAATDLDTVLLSLWRSPEEVGWYKAAYNLIFRLMFIRSALLSTLGPQMSRYYGVSKERVAKTFNSSLKFFVVFSFPIAIGTTVLASQIIELLYTDEYTNSATVLAILIWSLPLLYVSSLCGQVTTASDKEHKAMRVYITAALLNVVSNIIAIPIWGYIGAAASTIVTEAVALILFYRVIHPEFPLTDVRNSIVKPVLAGLLMGVAVFLLQDWPLLLVVGSGALIYGAILLALRPFNEQEWQLLVSLWEKARQKMGWGAPAE